MILLLRGLARHAAHWVDFPKLLDGETLCLDLPGTGTRKEVSSPIQMTKIVEDMRAQVRPHVKLQVVGVSLGGMVAASWASMYPEELESMVLINSSLPQLSPFSKRLSPTARKSFLEVPFIKDIEAREKKVLELVANDPAAREKNLAAWTAASRQYPMSIQQTVRQIVAATWMPPVKPSGVRTLVIGSEQDRLADVSCSHKIAEFLAAELRLHPTAGHDISTDDPEWLAREVNAFLAG